MQRTGDTAWRLRDFSREERRILWLLGLSFLLNQYDMALAGLALPQIQASLGVAESALGPLLGSIKVGALVAMPIALAADRAGRRRLLLATILGFTLFSGATALAQTPAQFALLQIGARACIVAEEGIAIVLVAEQLRAGGRGLGFGVLAIFGALGHGVAALSYGFVEVLPFGWRALYVVGAAPLLAIAWLRRSLGESERFVVARAMRGVEPTGVLAPLRELWAAYPHPLLALLAAIGAFGFVATPALGFVSKSLQDVHGWSPPEVTALIIGGGALAVASYPLAGVLSDRFGRRRILVCALLAHAAGVVAFYGASGTALVAAWIGMMFGFMAADVLFGALGAELFATTHRATATSFRMLVLAAGGALGLAVEGLLHAELGSHATGLAWMAAAVVVAVAAVARGIPETALRELEAIAPMAESSPRGAPS